VEGEPAGVIRTARNLTYILFYNAGHSVPYYHPHRSRIMLHQFIQLDLTSSSKQTTIKNIEETTRTTHRASKRLDLIEILIIIAIIALTGLVWFFVHKRQMSEISTPFSISRMLRSKNGDVERQQWAVYSFLDDSNEGLHAPDQS
jgi:hypothetical protein